MSASIYTMCALAILRFAGLMMPFKTHNTFITGQNSRKRHGTLLIVIIWMLATVLSFPTAVYYQLQDVEFKPDDNDTGNGAIQLLF